MKQEHQRLEEHVNVQPVQPSDRGIFVYDAASKRWNIAENTFMRWAGVWDGSTYEPYDVSLQNGYLGIAINQTDDPVAPVPIGDPAWVSSAAGTPSFTENTVNENFLVVVQRYTTPNSFDIARFRYLIPEENVGMVANFWLVVDPLGTSPDYQQLLANLTISQEDTETWIEIPIGSNVTPSGVAFDVVMTIAPTVGAQSFVAEWDYKRQNGNPSSGEAWHQSGSNQDTLRFHQVDQDDVNQDANLANIGPGSTISMAVSGYVWTVLEATKITGTVYEFIVDPASRAGEDSSNFTFTYYALSSMNYKVDEGFYSAYPSVTGWVGNAYDPDGMTMNDNAYGIDIYVQELDFSEDWQLLAVWR